MDVSTMWERDAARQWEELNDDNSTIRPIESLSDSDRIYAMSTIYVARVELGSILEYLDDAIERIKDTPQGDKLNATCDRLGEVIDDLKRIEKEVWNR